MASAFLFVRKNAGANIHYTDMDPDIILDSGGDEFNLDIDGDSNIDVLFANQSDYDPGYYSSGGSYVLPSATQKIWAWPFSDVSFAGMQHLTYYFSFRYWPYALEFNRQIDHSVQFQSDWSQLMFYRSAWFPSGGPESVGGFWIPDITDHYLGFRILGNDDLMHYGWIRCDVKDAGKTLIIKDYAWQIVPDYFIVTGDTLDNVEPVSSHIFSEASVYYSDHTIQVIMNVATECQFMLYDLSGRLMFQLKLNQKSERIPVYDFAHGSYIVVLRNGSDQYAKKIVIF